MKQYIQDILTDIFEIFYSFLMLRNIETFYSNIKTEIKVIFWRYGHYRNDNFIYLRERDLKTLPEWNYLMFFPEKWRERIDKQRLLVEGIVCIWGDTAIYRSPYKVLT
jgi:hypothetical protein